MTEEKTTIKRRRKRKTTKKRSVVDSAARNAAALRIPVKGVNGQIKNVIAVYQIDKGTDIPRMVTNYVERKK